MTNPEQDIDYQNLGEHPGRLEDIPGEPSNDWNLHHLAELAGHIVVTIKQQPHNRIIIGTAAAIGAAALTIKTIHEIRRHRHLVTPPQKDDT